MGARELSSFRSNTSNRNLILSSNLESEKRMSPLNNSSVSIRPFLSTSQTTKLDSLAPNICSNSVKSMKKLSQTLLNDPKNSLSLAKDTIPMLTSKHGYCLTTYC